MMHLPRFPDAFLTRLEFKEGAWGGLRSQYFSGGGIVTLGCRGLWKYCPQQLGGHPAGKNPKNNEEHSRSHQRYIFGAIATSYPDFFCPEHNF